MTKHNISDEDIVLRIKEKFPEERLANAELAKIISEFGGENEFDNSHRRVLLFLAVLSKNLSLCNELFGENSVKIDNHITVRERKINLFHIVAESGDERICDLLMRKAPNEVFCNLLREKVPLSDSVELVGEYNPLELTEFFNQAGVKEIILQRRANIERAGAVVQYVQSETPERVLANESEASPSQSPAVARPSAVGRVASGIIRLITPQLRR